MGKKEEEIRRKARMKERAYKLRIKIGEKIWKGRRRNRRRYEATWKEE